MKMPAVHHQVTLSRIIVEQVEAGMVCVGVINFKPSAHYPVIISHNSNTVSAIQKMPELTTSIHSYP